jgi:hypothetical protein
MLYLLYIFAITKSKFEIIGLFCRYIVMEMGLGLHIDVFSLYKRSDRFSPQLHSHVRESVQRNNGAALALVHPHFVARHALSEQVTHKIGYGSGADAYCAYRQSMTAFVRAYQGPVVLFVEHRRREELELWLDSIRIKTPTVIVTTVPSNPTPIMPYDFQHDPWEAMREVVGDLEVSQLEFAGELAYFIGGIPRGCVYLAFQELQGSHQSSRLSIINNHRDSWRPAVRREQRHQGDKFQLEVLQELTFPNTERD